MNSETLYIPLHGKAMVTKKGILLHDLMAVTLWNREGFPLKGRARSKWLAYAMAMRAKVFDDWTRAQLCERPDALVLHIGCGLDSRCMRVGGRSWYDIDLPQVIEKRREYFPESDSYHLLAADAAHPKWVADLPDSSRAVVILEGLSMYLPRSRVTALLRALEAKFPEVSLLMDVYTTFGAKASKFGNPVRSLGVTQVWGVDAPGDLRAMRFQKEHSMTPDHCLAELKGFERWFFTTCFAGELARRCCRVWEFREK